MNVAFLLTRLMRGVTDVKKHLLVLYRFLLTRLMRGVTEEFDKLLKIYKISTHTPHARRDNLRQFDVWSNLKFLLTRLMRGVT